MNAASSVLFDTSLPRLVEVVCRTLGDDALQNGVVLRDATGRLSFVGARQSPSQAERRRIAHELHDQMGQHLAALKLGLEGLTPAPADSERMQRLLGLVKQIGQDVRRIALELRPTMLDDLGLLTALNHALGEWSERSGIEVDFHCAGLGERRLPPPVETAVYRVVQEALTNVLKHAGADRV